MPDANVDTFRKLVEAFNAQGLEGVLRFFDEEVEVYDPDLAAGESIRGHAGVRRVIGDMVDGFEVLKVQDFEAIPVGDRVVALVHSEGYGEGRRGEMGVELRDAHTMTFRDGKVVYWRLYLDQAEALSDSGLDPGLAEQHRAGDVPAP